MSPLAGFNELNLQVTRQHSRISAEKQELEFKSNQLNDLKEQIETNASQLKQTLESISESQDLLGQAEGLLIGADPEKGRRGEKAE